MTQGRRRPRRLSARGGALEDRPHRVDRVGVLGALVRAGIPSRARTGAPGRPGSAGSPAGRRTPPRRRARAGRGRRCPRASVSSSRSRSVCHASISSVIPLNVLPSITKPPVRVARAQVQVAEPSLAAAVAPLGGEHDQVERVRALDLEPAGAAAAGLVRRVERLHHHPLVPARERVVEERLGGLGVLGDRARNAQRLGRAARSSMREPLAARGGRSGPRRPGAGRSKKNGDSGVVSRWRPRRSGSRTGCSVTWNGCGRPSGRSAIASPSRIAAPQRQSATSPPRPRARDRSRRRAFRANARTSPPSEVHLEARRRRASTRRRPGGSARARRPMSAAVCASIGCTGRRTVSRNAARPASPSAIAARGHGPQIALEHQRAPNLAAGTPAAAATPSDHASPRARPAGARPIRSPARNACSGSVARANSAASSVRAGLLAPLAGSAPDPLERGVHLEHLEGGSGRRRRAVAERRPADADRALRQPAREVGDRDRYLLRAKAVEGTTR